MNTIKFAKVTPDAIIPSKRKEDAGYDIYMAPEQYGFGETIKEYYLNPGQIKVFSTGIASAFDAKYVCQLKDKSSLAAKGLHILGGVIDSGYRGEWRVVVINLGSNEVAVPVNKAICQAVFTQISQDDAEEIPYEELLDIESERGVGGFGSTNK